MFTRRHYIEIAAEIRSRLHSDACIDSRVREGVEMVAFDLATLFARDNGNFQEMRFLDACGIE